MNTIGLRARSLTETFIETSSLVQKMLSYTYRYDANTSYSPAALAHELIGHAYDNDCGNRTDAVSEQNSIPLIEISSINIQNIILKEHKLNERTQYGFDNGRRWVDIPKDLLNTFFTPNRKQ